MRTKKTRKASNVPLQNAEQQQQQDDSSDSGTKEPKQTKDSKQCEQTDGVITTGSKVLFTIGREIQENVSSLVNSASQSLGLPGVRKTVFHVYFAFWVSFGILLQYMSYF